MPMSHIEEPWCLRRHVWTSLVLVMIRFCVGNTFFYLNLARFSVVFSKFFLYSLPVGKYLGCSKTFPSCVMSLTVESKSFTAIKILQWVAVIWIMLSPGFSGELDSTVMGVVYRSLKKLISDVFLIMRSLISVMHRFLREIGGNRYGRVIIWIVIGHVYGCIIVFPWFIVICGVWL